MGSASGAERHCKSRPVMQTLDDKQVLSSWQQRHWNLASTQHGSRLVITGNHHRSGRGMVSQLQAIAPQQPPLSIDKSRDTYTTGHSTFAHSRNMQNNQFAIDGPGFIAVYLAIFLQPIVDCQPDGSRQMCMRTLRTQSSATIRQHAIHKQALLVLDARPDVCVSAHCQ